MWDPFRKITIAKKGSGYGSSGSACPESITLWVQHQYHEKVNAMGKTVGNVVLESKSLKRHIKMQWVAHSRKARKIWMGLYRDWINNRKLPAEKSPGQEDFTDKFYRMFKKELTLIIH
jgi:hypothetical protein